MSTRKHHHKQINGTKESDIMIERIKRYVKIFVGTPHKVSIFSYESGYLARITIRMVHPRKNIDFYMHHFVPFNEYTDIRSFYMMIERGLIKRFEKQYEPSSVTSSKVKFLNAITHDYFQSFKEEKPIQHFVYFPCGLKIIRDYVFQEPTYQDCVIGSVYSVKSILI